MGAIPTDSASWIERLRSAGQDHLFPEGSAASDVERLVGQIAAVDKTCPGGVFGYVERAKVLLKDSKDGVNPFEGCEAVPPECEVLNVGTEMFSQMETLGSEQMASTAFVMVAGGLGERLGWNDIKISLPSESSTGTCYMELYAQSIRAAEERASKELGESVILPLAIMTSDDTHDKTVALLKDNGNFGLREEQVTIMKQVKVPALIDNNARMAVSSSDAFALETKPHGHGDVHTLLYQNGLPKKWAEDGFKWVLFFQDTNGLAFRSLPALLGVSAHRNFAFNTMTIPRTPGEALGGISKLKKSDGTCQVRNVEYNQLDPVLRATNGKGDVADSTGNSPFPGNTNNFVMSLPLYARKLAESEGVVPEFVNPKYADAEREKFKSPTRLECMMQDFAVLFDGVEEVVGCTQMERWVSFSCVKNNRIDAAAKSKSNSPSDCAFSGEADQYNVCAKLLRIAGEHCGVSPLNIPEPESAEFGGVKYQMGPRIVMMPSFAISLEELKRKLEPCRGKPLVIGMDSTLVLEGDVEVRGLQLNGTVVARAASGEKIIIDNEIVDNAGWEMKALQKSDEADEAEKNVIRGFKIVKHEQREFSAVKV